MYGAQERFNYQGQDYDLRQIHLQRFDTGAAVGPEFGTNIDDGSSADPDTFTGLGENGIAGFADTSTADSLGQLFAVHNDDNQQGGNDVALAQLDLATGGKKSDTAIPGTNGATVSSSLLATPPNAAGGRELFFVAYYGTSTRLFRVPVADAGSAGASIGTVTSVAVPQGNPYSSPTLAYLRDPAGNPRPYVAVGAKDTSQADTVQTYAASDLAPGPRSGNLGGSAQTPTVPLASSGLTPGEPGSGVQVTPHLYVALDTGGNTRVHRVTQAGSSQTLTSTASSPSLGGAPSPGIATSQRIDPERRGFERAGGCDLGVQPVGAAYE
ncbi:MAG: hypothetical protein WKF31_00420 [Thermoleophilaceae bacterium]